MPEKEKSPEREKKTPAIGIAEDGEAAARLDRVIAGVEKVYEALTGASPPAGGEIPTQIPVERQPGEFVSERLERLLAALQQPMAPTGWSPPVSVWEGERDMVICVEVAGVKPDEVALSVEANALILRGSRGASDDGLKLLFSERPLGTFERRILVPQRVDLTSPDAQLVDGVLEIRLPKVVPTAVGRREVRVA